MAPEFLNEQLEWLEIMADRAYEIEQAIRESNEEDWEGSPNQK